MIRAQALRKQFGEIAAIDGVEVYSTPIENCIHCLFCWIYCPDSAITVDLEGEKPLVTGVNLDHCKGCGICAEECPKKAITMVREED